LKKVALDEAAKKYWKQLFKELGYGEDLVRDIARRIKAALHESKKVASISDTATVTPVAHVRGDDCSIIEGVYTDAKTRLLFKASLDVEGNVKDIKTVTLRG
jgi:hypothetical protein